MIPNLSVYLLTAAMALGVFSGFFGLVVWIRQREERALGAFAVYCFMAVVYWVAVLWLYGTATLEDRLLSARFLHGAVAFLTVAYVWFVGAFAGRRDRLVRTLAAIVWGLFLLGAVMSPTGVIAANFRGMVPMNLPWGEVIYRHDGDNHLGGALFFLCLFAVRFYCLWVVYWLFRQGERRRAWALGMFCVVDTAGLVVDTLVVLFKVDFILVAVFSTVLVMVAMVVYFADELHRRTLALKSRNEELRLSEVKFRSIAESSLVGIAIVQDDVFRFVNVAAARMLGYTPQEILGLGRGEFAQLVHEEDRAFVVAQATAKQRGDEDVVPRYEFRVVTKGGETRWLETQSATMPYGDGLADLILLRDITERRSLERQLGHSRKMDAVGQVAGGVAHDFNNILQTLMASTELLEGSLEGEGDTRPEDSRELTQILLTEITRASALTRKLLVFSRKDEQQVAPVDLQEMVAQLSKILSRILGSQIEISFTHGNAPAWVQGDVAQLEQVLLNLSINARDAMPDGGTLKVATDVATLSADSPYLTKDMESGLYVLLTVTDTGCGMDDATREQIFEPFFTTKPLGQGTGLGLSTVYAVVEQHGGSIQVESTEGQGSAFTLYLPAINEPTDVQALLPSDSVVQGAGTLLLAEDEEFSRILMARILEDAGYRVLRAADGQAAMALIDSHHRELVAAVLDQIMPLASGREVLQHLRKLRPNLPVISVSGYTPDRDRHLNQLGIEGPRLSKPFSRLELLQAVKDALDSKV